MPPAFSSASLAHADRSTAVFSGFLRFGFVNRGLGGDNRYGLVDLPAMAVPARREFENFYREHFAATWRALSRFGVPTAERDDVAQEVFVTAHRRWSMLRDVGWPRAWVLGIARRIASRHRRGGDRRAHRIEALASMSIPPRGLEDELMRREAWRSLAAFLDSLDDHRRDAFVLGELEQLSRPELATALGVQPSTAYSRLLSARRRFADHFAGLRETECAAVLRAYDDQVPVADALTRGWLILAPTIARNVVSPIALSALVGKVALAAGLTAVAATALAPAAHVEPRPAVDGGAGRVAAAASVPAEPPAVSTVQRPNPPPEAPPPVEATVRAPDRPKSRQPLEPSVSPSGGDPQAEEVALLAAARTAALAGERARANALLDEHARRFGAVSRLGDLRRDIARDLETAAPIVNPPRRGDSYGQEPR